MSQRNFPPKAPYWQLWLKGDHDYLSFFLNASAYGDIVQLPRKQHYLINDPAALQEMLQQKNDNYTKVGTHFQRLEKMLGPGLLVNSGNDWSSTRQLVQQVFHYKNLIRYEEVIAEQLAQTIERLDESCAKNQLIAFDQELLMLFAKISAAVLIGADMTFAETAQVIKQIAFANNFIANSLSTAKFYPSWRNIYFQIIKVQYTKFLRQKLSSNTQFQPLLEPILAEYRCGHISEKQLRGEINNFFIAGHETIGNAMAWTTLLLAQHEEIFNQVAQEASAVLQQEKMSFSAIEKISYGEQVLCEAMRLYPPIWLTQRRALIDDELQGYAIPKGALLSFSPYVLHRHPRYWPDCDEFRPERFSTEEVAKRPKLAYVPFGAGPRVCIGRHLAMILGKWVLATLASRYHWRIENAARIQVKTMVTLCPDEPLLARLVRR